MLTSYQSLLSSAINRLGGKFNAHLHIDRVDSYQQTLLEIGAGSVNSSSLALAAKHQLIPLMHNSDLYSEKSLRERVLTALEAMAENGTTRADSVVDVTPDRVGLTALKTLNQVKAELSSVLDFQIGAYTPLGFRDDQPERWQLIETAIESADFLGALPERDDKSDYPSHIGFTESCERLLLLADRHNKAIHIHTDQQNHDQESASEILVSIVKKLKLDTRSDNEPWIWLVHVISPSTYDEGRFQALAQSLAELNIGIICCPSAAISMRQLRPVSGPTYNSIARVLDFLAAGVHVRLGSDNIADITSPFGTLDLIDELFVLSNAMRYYDIDVLAHLAAGLRLPLALVSRVADHLQEDKRQVELAIKKYRRD